MLLAGCERSRALNPPKAVPLREDGAFDLRLMSFNVRYETPNDRGAYSWRQRIRGSVNMIRRQKPDIIGDFNSVESNPGYLHLTESRTSLAGSTTSWANGMTDTYQKLHPGQENRRSLHFWKGNRDGPLKVDHIMVSRGAKVLEAAIVWEDDPVVSDHFPVTASVIFP